MAIISQYTHTSNHYTVHLKLMLYTNCSSIKLEWENLTPKESYILAGQEVSKLSDNELAVVRGKILGFVFQKNAL